MLAACLLSGLAATRTPAGSQKENAPDQPIYLDSTEGLRRLEESHARQSFVPLSMYFVSQETQTFCGVVSATMVLNALVPKDDRPNVPEWKPYRLFAQSVFFTNEVEKIAPRKDVLERGMTLAQLGAVLGTFPVKVEVFHACENNNEDAFRKAAKAVLNDHDKYLISNFLRTAVGQVGAGHFSPIAAYHEKTDSFLVYDVAALQVPAILGADEGFVERDECRRRRLQEVSGYVVVRTSPH